MRFFYIASVVASLAFVPGCSEKSTIKEESKITTPTGTKTIKTETEVKKTGDEKTP